MEKTSEIPCKPMRLLEIPHGLLKGFPLQNFEEISGPRNLSQSSLTTVHSSIPRKQQVSGSRLGLTIQLNWIWFICIWSRRRWTYLSRCLPGRDLGREGLSPAWTQRAGSSPAKKRRVFTVGGKRWGPSSRTCDKHSNQSNPSINQSINFYL